MTSHSQRRFGTGIALTPVEHAKKRLRRYLRNHPEGLSTGQLNAWIDSVRKGGVIKLPEFQTALREMTAAGEAVCSGGLWWLRRAPVSLRPAEGGQSFREFESGPLFDRLRRPSS